MGDGGHMILVSNDDGVRSEGMICSEKELGISAEHEGILFLPDDAVPGTPLADVLRIARELRSGMLVNLGIGIPTMVANFVPTGKSAEPY